MIDIVEFIIDFNIEIVCICMYFIGGYFGVGIGG